MSTVEEQAAEAGREWATDVGVSLRSEGRRVAGGWPGTLREAHSRMHRLDADGALSHAERTHLASVLYGAARERWLLVRDATR